MVNSNTQEAIMSVQEYAEQAVHTFVKDITDHMFLSIERNGKLLQEYTDSVKQFGVEAVNTTIGKKVKELLNLNNIDEVKATSSLIKTYTRHSIT
jgi:hypothetical protein